MTEHERHSPWSANVPPSPPPPASPPASPPAPPRPAGSGPIAPDPTFKIISDTLIGPNVRLRDNLIQGAAVVVGTALGAIIGALLAEDRGVGAAIGALAGLIGSILISGFGLMIYRAVRHASGHHD